MSRRVLLLSGNRTLDSSANYVSRSRIKTYEIPDWGIWFAPVPVLGFHTYNVVDVIQTAGIGVCVSVLRSPAAQRCKVLSSAPYPIGDGGLDATQEDVDLYGDRALLSFLTLEHRAFLACQRTSLAVRVIVLAIFFVPLGVINPIDASWLYSWLAFYVCLEVIAVLSERSATKKVQQRLASLIKYGSKHRLLRLSEVTELPLVEISRRLVFGAVLGADAAVLMFALYPALFPGADFGEVLYAGSAVGAAVSQLLERWLAALISPMSRRTKRYLTLVELALARGKGTLSEAHANALREKAQNEYFHDDTASRAKGRLRTRFEIE